MRNRREALASGLAGLAAGCGLSTQDQVVDQEPLESESLGLAGLLTDAARTRTVVTQGIRRAGSEKRIGPNDLWHIGSNAKAMTAALYARLVEKGLAAWGIALPELFSGIQLHPRWKDVTVDQLMSQTSGLSDAGILGTWNLIKSELDERPLPEQRSALAAKALAAPPAGEQGAFRYSNANYILLGSAIERLSGSSWEIAIAEEVFGPLDMKSAGFGAPVGDQPYGHRSSWLPWKGPKAVAPGPAADNPAFMRPAGGVHLALEDYAKFLRIFIQEKNQFLSAATLSRLTQPSGAVNYALGWMVEEIPWAGGRALVHDGSNTMWYATALVALERDVAAIAVSNQGTAAAARATHQLLHRLISQSD